MQSSVVVQKNWALSVGRCWLQVLQFLVYLMDLLSILLRCTGFSGIQKAVVDQTGSRPPNTFFGASLTSQSALERPVSLTTELVVTSCHIKPTFLNTLNPVEKWFVLLCRIREDNTSKKIFFCQLMRHPLLELFYLFNLLQMSNDYKMVNAEYFSNLSCSCKRISFDLLCKTS